MKRLEHCTTNIKDMLEWEDKFREIKEEWGQLARVVERLLMIVFVVGTVMFSVLVTALAIPIPHITLLNNTSWIRGDTIKSGVPGVSKLSTFYSIGLTPPPRGVERRILAHFVETGFVLTKQKFANELTDMILKPCWKCRMQAIMGLKIQNADFWTENSSTPTKSIFLNSVCPIAS